MNAKAVRLELSSRTIRGWEQLGGPGGRAEDSLRMIREELAVLAAIDDPKARMLELRYGEMAKRIRMSLA